jgi:hypothetical protein
MTGRYGITAAWVDIHGKAPDMEGLEERTETGEPHAHDALRSVLKKVELARRKCRGLLRSDDASTKGRVQWHRAGS